MTGGTLEPGRWADLVVFDPAGITSHCSVKEPRRYAAGIAHVLVNGSFAILAGERTGADGGRVLRHH